MPPKITEKLWSKFWIFWSLESKTRRPASTGIFFAQLKTFWINFWKYKKKTSVFNLVFNRSPQILTPPLISTIPGIIELSCLRNKARSPRYFSESFFEILWDFISGNQATTFRGNKFDYRERPQQIALSPISKSERTNTGKLSE